MPAGSKFPDVSQFSKEQGLSWAFDSQGRGKVIISGVSASIPVTMPTGGMNNVNVTWTPFTLSGVTGATVISAQGATTGIQVRGWSINNESAALKRYEVRYGGTAWARGSLAASGGAFNWNMIGHYFLAPNNKAIRIVLTASGTVTGSIAWRKV